MQKAPFILLYHTAQNFRHKMQAFPVACILIEYNIQKVCHDWHDSLFCCAIPAAQSRRGE